MPNALAFTRGARTKPSVTESEHKGRFTQAGAVGVQRLVGQLVQGTTLAYIAAKGGPRHHRGNAVVAANPEFLTAARRCEPGRTRRACLLDRIRHGGLDPVAYSRVHTWNMDTKPRLLGIGEVARGAGIGVETVRFYEKEGLLPKPARRPSGYRQYEPDVVQRIRFVQSAKSLGFTLKEIRELLSLRVTRGKTCADVKLRALAKLADVDAKLTELQRMREALARLADSCSGAGPTSTCPLLDALNIQGDDHADR